MIKTSAANNFLYLCIFTARSSIQVIGSDQAREKKRGIFFTCACFFDVDDDPDDQGFFFVEGEGKRVYTAWPTVGAMNPNLVQNSILIYAFLVGQACICRKL